MGQKIHPLGFRIGITERWRSRWYAQKRDFSRYILEDFNIRKHIKKNYGYSSIPMIEIERTRDKINVILHTARPGLIIGKKGNVVDKLREELAKFVKDKKSKEKPKDIDLEIKEVARPHLNATLVAENIAEQLVKRANFRRTMKKAMDSATEAGVPGIKMLLAGRLGGAEMARSEGACQGKVPLQTLSAHIDYGFAEAHTTYGLIGIKVWIYLGQYNQEEVLNAVDAKKGKVQKRTARKN